MLKIRKNIDDNKIRELYKDGKSTREIGKIIGCSGVTVSSHLKKMGTKIRDLHNSRKIYSFNENYFENIDCEQKAYWLGFIAADGCILEQTSQISKRTGRTIKKEQMALQIALKQDDKSHLEKLQNNLRDNHNLHYSVKRKCWDIKLLSDKLCKDLLKYGIKPKKSLTLQFPLNLISNEYIPSFIRGYFDGDGSISFSKNKKGLITISKMKVSILGTKDFLETINEIINREIFFSERIFPAKSNNINGVQQIMFSNIHKTKQFLDFIYKDATIYLDRKYERYLIFNKKYEEYINNKLRKQK